jgi:hypothetical protein
MTVALRMTDDLVLGSAVQRGGRGEAAARETRGESGLVAGVSSGAKGVNFW